MSELRKKVVKLAKENPELRKHLLPILKESSEVTAARLNDNDLVTTKDQMFLIALQYIQANPRNFEGFTPQMADKLAQIVADALWRNMKNEQRSAKRLKLTYTPDKVKTFRMYMPAQTRNYKGLVEPFDFKGASDKEAWDWKRDGLMPIDSKLLGKRLPGRVLREIGPHYSGGKFVIIKRDTAGMRGTQDSYQKVVVDESGIITHDFGSVPSIR